MALHNSHLDPERDCSAAIVDIVLVLGALGPGSGLMKMSGRYLTGRVGWVQRYLTGSGDGRV